MPLDPIVSLSVAIAEAPGSYAFFLGSGVSKDAGVPTGSEVFWRAVGELYRLEKAVDETPDEAGLGEWLDESGRGDSNYADILELIAPDPATRRDYLAKHFEGVEPGATHERLAELAAAGLVKVFVTTNFDRLLEHALQARGIEPVVITSEADVDAAPRREHADCYVLKPHGDYLQQTIRNTPSELAALPPGMTAELKEVVDRYGLVILGYSGSDEAIAEVMRSRRSRYGLYWVARGELAPSAKALVEAVTGRVIVREGAASFLAALDRRLAVFAAHPSGLTPVTVHDQVISLLRRGDRVGLREQLRVEQREYESDVSAFIDGRNNELPTAETALTCHDDLLPIVERRLASLLPLVVHDGELFAEQVARLADFKERQEVPDGYTFWSDLPGWCAWWLGHAVGALAARERRFAALGSLFAAEASDRFGATVPLVESIPGNTGQEIGSAVMAVVDNQNWLAPAWEALKRDLKQCQLLQERYPELVSSDKEPFRSLVQFDFLLNLALGLREHRSISHWTMYEQPANDFARRLHADARLRSALADAFGLSLEEFDAKAPGALRAGRALGSFPEQAAISILETGATRL